MAINFPFDIDCSSNDYVIQSESVSYNETPLGFFWERFSFLVKEVDIQVECYLFCLAFPSWENKWKCETMATPRARPPEGKTSLLVWGGQCSKQRAGCWEDNAPWIFSPFCRGWTSRLNGKETRDWGLLQGDLDTHLPCTQLFTF